MAQQSKYIEFLGPRYQTRQAADYLTQNGCRTSPSKLEKERSRGSDDPRDKGPDFFRDERGICWYPQRSLDRYMEKRLAALRFRGTAEQPANFRRTD